jgi:hypothetical protein
VSKPAAAYEPAFGGIVSVLAGALLCFVLFASWATKGSYTGTAFFSIICVRVIAWGVSQIVGYRKAKRNSGHDPQQEPLLGTALSCTLVGLLLVPVTVMFYEFAPNHPIYAYASGGVTVILLSLVFDKVFGGNHLTIGSSDRGSIILRRSFTTAAHSLVAQPHR